MKKIVPQSTHRCLSDSRKPTLRRRSMYLRIDTHKRYSQIAVVDGDGNLDDESRLPNDRLNELAEQYAGSEAAIEASGTYRPVYEMLNEHLDVTLINPSKNRIIADATIKTDCVYAKRLAHMLRADMLSESYVPPDEIPQCADLVRTRKSLVEERTVEKNRVRAALTRTDNTYGSESIKRLLMHTSLSSKNSPNKLNKSRTSSEWSAQRLNTCSPRLR